VTYQPDPEYSEEARKAKYQGDVTLAGTVDPHGELTDLCVVQALGAGLDEKAIGEARRWRFEPATLEGKPVAFRISVEVTFRMY
jgi:TonB family protein